MHIKSKNKFWLNDEIELYNNRVSIKLLLSNFFSLNDEESDYLSTTTISNNNDFSKEMLNLKEIICGNDNDNKKTSSLVNIQILVTNNTYK
ncbi:hypothetical protein Glove_707g105 [Diversispora epigaea]|uniref:Uncharacterized protein n=1 Tax=Diversispora epigaea TaxID=1348612 RepID=A0A397G6B0_9GLOM|nr:hypothetical protein Glove_707g105 [Diversispora epigaea]